MAYKKYEPGDFTEAIIQKMLDSLADGNSMARICADPDMPDADTFKRWADRDDGLADAIARAREIGYLVRGDRAVEAAKSADDAALGRLAFDAERWYLGKLSRAFAEKPAQFDGKMKVGTDGAFDRIASALERAAGAIAGGAVGKGGMAGEGEA